MYVQKGRPSNFMCIIDSLSIYLIMYTKKQAYML